MKRNKLMRNCEVAFQFRRRSDGAPHLQVTANRPPGIYKPIYNDRWAAFELAHHMVKSIDALCVNKMEVLFLCEFFANVKYLLDQREKEKCKTTGTSETPRK